MLRAKIILHALGGLLALAVCTPASAQIEPFPFSFGDEFENIRVQNWDPVHVELACGKPKHPARPTLQDVSCFSEEIQKLFPQMFPFAAVWYLDQKLRSPDGLGPVIRSYAQPDVKVIRVFSHPGYPDALAYVSPDSCNRDSDTVLALVPEAMAQSASWAHAQATVAAHELYHAMDMAGPTAKRCSRVGWYRPHWISEAIPDAMGTKFAEFAVGSAFPVSRFSDLGFQLVGLRPYFFPLNYPFEELEITGSDGKHHPLTYAYETSSFWVYLTDRFHHGNVRFLQSYLDTEAPAYGGGKEDWLAWLDANLSSDKKVKAPLYTVLPSFFTDFAAQVGKGGRGVKFGRELWMDTAFDGCEPISLSPTHSYAEIEVSIDNLAAVCLSVKVADVAPDDLVSIKLGVLTEDLDLADSLHLGMAFTNDASRFNCAKATREGKLPQGVTGCLFEPVTGNFRRGRGNIRAARMWFASSFEYGPGGQTAKIGKNTATGAIENVYILARVPTELETRFNDGKRRTETVRLAAGIDVTTLNVEGAKVNKGPADGKRAAKRTRATGAMRLRPSETDRSEPAHAGYMDLGPAEQILGQEVVDLVAANSDILSQAKNAFPGMLDSGLVLFKLAESEVIPPAAPVPLENELIEVIREFSVVVPEPIGVGATGSFEVMIVGTNRRVVGTVYGSPKDQLATVTIEENSDTVFRARVEGMVCEYNMLAGPVDQPCQRKFHLSGSIVKPFAYLYQPDSELVSIQTEGEILYNRYQTAQFGAMMEQTDGNEAGGGGPGPGAGSGDGSGAAGMGSVATILECDCACPDAVVPDTPQCRAQCVSELALCKAGDAASGEAPQQSERPKPTVEAQQKWLGRLLGRHGVDPETQQMLIEDFAAMNDETRAYLLRRYRKGID